MDTAAPPQGYCGFIAEPERLIDARHSDRGKGTTRRFSLQQAMSCSRASFCFGSGVFIPATINSIFGNDVQNRFSQ